MWQFSQSDRCRNALATDLQEWYAKGAARVQRRLASQGHGFVTHRLWELWESHFPFPEQWCIPQIQYFIYVYLSCSLNSVILEENMPLYFFWRCSKHIFKCNLRVKAATCHGDAAQGWFFEALERSQSVGMCTITVLGSYRSHCWGCVKAQLWQMQ